MATPDGVRERLQYLRGEIEAESISYEEIAELQGLAEFIEPGDVQLLEWAGVPEDDDDGPATDGDDVGPLVVVDEGGKIQTIFE